jgi:hypothetical protein
MVVFYCSHVWRVFLTNSQEVKGGEMCKSKVLPMPNYGTLYQDVGGNRGVAPLTRNLGARWRWMVSYTVGKGVPYTLRGRLGGSQGHAQCYGEQKSLLPLSGVNLRVLIVHLWTYSLYRLGHSGRVENLHIEVFCDIFLLTTYYYYYYYYYYY